MTRPTAASAPAATFPPSLPLAGASAVALAQMPPVSVAVSLDNPTVPPYWALLERELLQGISDGCIEFFEQ